MKKIVMVMFFPFVLCSQGCFIGFPGVEFSGTISASGSIAPDVDESIVIGSQITVEWLFFGRTRCPIDVDRVAILVSDNEFSSPKEYEFYCEDGGSTLPSLLDGQVSISLFGLNENNDVTWESEIHQMRLHGHNQTIEISLSLN